MICRECGGECPLGTDDYDSVIHQGDCSRLRVIRMLRQFPIISDLEVQAHTCHVDGRIIDHGISRTCPAWGRLMRVISRNPVPGCFCSKEQILKCYNKHFVTYEEDVLAAAFFIED